jgi:phage shock protein C
MKRLYRSRDERMVAGVAGGIGEYLDLDPTLLRLAFVALTLAGGGSGLLAYLILAIIMPLEPEVRAERARAEAGVAPHGASEEEIRREVQEAQIPEYQP